MIRFFQKIAAFASLALVLVTVEQVLARYLFSATNIALQELEWHLFALIFLFSAAYSYQQDAHVRVDILHAKFSTRVQNIIELFGIIFFLIPMCGIIIFYGSKYALQAIDFDSSKSLDHFSAYYFSTESSLYTFSAMLEKILRSYVLIGEGSPNPGGLEARWLIKATMPLAFFLLLLQAIQRGSNCIAQLYPRSKQQ